MRHLYGLMSETFLGLSHPIEEFDEYLKGFMAEDLKRCHVEVDNEKSVVRRWVAGVLHEMQNWEQPKVMQTLKVLKSEKLSCSNKWAVAIVPLEDFNLLNCISIKQVFLPNSAQLVFMFLLQVESAVRELGGMMHSANLLKDDCQDDSYVVGKNTTTRWALLVPLYVLKSATVCKICQCEYIFAEQNFILLVLFSVSNQLQLQQLVDFETPSGFSDVLTSQFESTRTSDNPDSLRLELSEITASTPAQSSSRSGVASRSTASSTAIRNEQEERGPFATLITGMNESEKSGIEEEAQDINFIDDLPSEDWTEEDDESTEFDFEDRVKSSSKIRSFRNETRSKANHSSSDSFTSINVGNTTAMVCNVCKSVFTSKSGFTRHKCKPSTSSFQDVTILKCDGRDCKRVFSNMSALTRHSKIHSSVSSLLVEKPAVEAFKCDQCKSEYKKELNLKKHKSNKHKEAIVNIIDDGDKDQIDDDDGSSSKADQEKEIHCDTAENSQSKSDDSQKQFHCVTCPSSFTREYNLKKHTEKKHDENLLQRPRRRRSISAHKARSSARK